MKIFEDKLTTVKTGEEGKERPLSYADLAREIINQTPRGITMDVMRQRIRVLNALDTMVDGKVNMEDADVKTLKEASGSFIWAFPHKDFVAFSDYINSL